MTDIQDSRDSPGINALSLKTKQNYSSSFILLIWKRPQQNVNKHVVEEQPSDEIKENKQEGAKRINKLFFEIIHYWILINVVYVIYC